MNFHRRLLRCVKRGDLTRQDLACWFDRPYSTIRYWLVQKRGQEEDNPQGREAHRRLRLLEQVIAGDPRFPVPPLGQRERRFYVDKIVGDYFGRNDVSNPRSAA